MSWFAGYDMDYTLVHYDVCAWEGKAFKYMLQNLQSMGCPIQGLHFDPTLVTRGLIVDQERGNLVKADRFGCVAALCYCSTTVYMLYITTNWLSLCFASSAHAARCHVRLVKISRQQKQALSCL